MTQTTAIDTPAASTGESDAGAPRTPLTFDEHILTELRAFRADIRKFREEIQSHDGVLTRIELLVGRL